ncbi:MAG TPA: transaldolase family protein, partial [bacterium]|nr:transaldolase family protein [bacterium]
PVDGISAIESMRNAIDRSSLDLRILAASLKSSAECSEAMAAGAHDITASADVLGALAEHPLSEKALNDFESAIRNRN